MRRLAVVLAALVAVLVPCARAAAQFAPLPSAPQSSPPVTQQPAPQPVAPSSSDDGPSTLVYALIFGAAGLLIAGIACVIVRDAKRNAPGSPRAGAGSGREAKPTTREREQARRRQRNRAKAARRQRKRNRGR